MEVYARFDREYVLLGIYTSKTDNTADSEKTELFISECISLLRVDGYTVYRVLLDKETYLILADGYAAALVEAVLLHRQSGKNIDIEHCRVLEYDLTTEELDKSVRIEPKEIELSHFCEQLLSALTPENRDLVAHAIESVEGCNTEDDLIRREYERNTPAHTDGKDGFYSGLDAMTDSEIIEINRSIFFNTYLIEQGADFPKILSVLNRYSKITDRYESIFCRMLVERFGGFDCRFPHYLYRALIDGRFDAYFSSFANNRELFCSG